MSVTNWKERWRKFPQGFVPRQWVLKWLPSIWKLVFQVLRCQIGLKWPANKNCLSLNSVYMLVFWNILNSSNCIICVRHNNTIFCLHTFHIFRNKLLFVFPKTRSGKRKRYAEGKGLSASLMHRSKEEKFALDLQVNIFVSHLTSSIDMGLNWN